MSKRVRLRVLSLFSGIGGIDLGLERAGFTIVAHSEIDQYASRVLAKHWPGVPNVGDITKADWSDWVGHVDVIAGGFPCQDISLAGKGAGIEGSRSGLWSEYARVVRVLRPRYVIVENVAALLSRGLDRVLGDLASLGYDAWWDCIPAASVGAPHRRDRVFIVATRADVAAFDTDTSPMQWASQQHAEASANPERFSSERRREPGIVVGSAGACEGEGHQWERDGNAIEHLRSTTPNARGIEYERDSEDCYDGLRIPLADTDGSGSQRWEDQRSNGGPQLSPVERGGREPASHWSTEPGVGRVADGVPYRVDRLRCLGNAVVPQVAEYIGHQIMQREAAA